MNFKKWVKSIQTAGYNGARTVFEQYGLSFFMQWYIRFLPGWSGAEIKCTVYVALPKTAYKLVLTGLAKQTTGAYSLLF